MFSDLGGDRAHQHKSKMCVLPNIVYCIVLLCFTPPATASSTSSPRSCHLAVVGDRPALPAKSPSLPVVLVGAAPEWTRLNTSEQLGTRPRERPVMKTTLGPALACHHARAPSFWDAAPRQEQTDARLSTRWVMAAPMRQRAPSPEVHSHRWITLKSARVMRAAWATSGTAHGELRLAGAVSGWSDASQLPLRAEDRSSSDMRDDARMLPSLYCDSSSSTDRHGCDAITSKQNFVDKFGLLAKRLIPRQDTCSLAASLPTSRTTSRLLRVTSDASSRCVTTRMARTRATPVARAAAADSTSRRHCRGTGARCLGPKCPCARRLPGPQDPDRGDGPLLARPLRLKPRTRALRVPRSPVPTALASLSW
jgi:hypothetical protein